ncbi:MAG: hypothetical protein ACI3W5_09420 [Faecousia sp.]
MGGFFFWAEKEGFENYKSQYAGGILLQPVQKLVATLIKQIPPSPRHPFGWLQTVEKGGRRSRCPHRPFVKYYEFAQIYQ